MDLILELFCRRPPRVRTYEKHDNKRAGRVRTSEERLSPGTGARSVPRLHEEIGDHPLID